MLLRLLLPLLFVLALQQGAGAATNFTQCMLDVKSGLYGPRAGVDNAGHFVPDLNNATAIPYGVCKEHCGTGPTSFVWSTFAQEFSAWLLPYLALLSQLPFGAHDRWDNLLGVLLTVGSPAIAAYSIVITVLNGRWIARLFGPYTYPNSRNAVRILSSLQQSPLRIHPDGCLLPSLIVLPENDEWWSELVVWLEYAHSWSISASSSIAWVVVAYVFTIIDSFTDDIAQTVEVNGQGVGSIWLWLIPIVIAWLQISPKCDSARVRQALDRANELAYVATYDRSAIRASRMGNQRAIYLDNDRLQTLHADEHVSVPVYNYARLFTWTESVQAVAASFSEATRHADSFEPVDPEAEWVEGNRYLKVRPENRSGTSFQVQTYCVPELASPPNPYASGIWSRMTLAILAALGLQWGTAGAAFLIVYTTPTTGLGCRSGAYLIYAASSTVVMAMLVLSSILAHYASNRPLDPAPFPLKRPIERRALAWTSILLRKLGKCLAVANAVWLMLACFFQFTAFFDRCYCDSSVLGRGAALAYDVIIFNHEDVSAMKVAWVGGVVLAVGSAALFIIFINLMIVNPRLH